MIAIIKRATVEEAPVSHSLCAPNVFAQIAHFLCLYIVYCILYIALPPLVYCYYWNTFPLLVYCYCCYISLLPGCWNTDWLPGTLSRQGPRLRIRIVVWILPAVLFFVSSFMHFIKRSSLKLPTSPCNDWLAHHCQCYVWSSSSGSRSMVTGKIIFIWIIISRSLLSSTVLLSWSSLPPKILTKTTAATSSAQVICY